MEAQDFYEQSKHQMSEALDVFKAYSLGEELDPAQLAGLRLLANELVRVFDETIENRRGAE